MNPARRLDYPISCVINLYALIINLGVIIAVIRSIKSIFLYGKGECVINLVIISCISIERFPKVELVIINERKSIIQCGSVRELRIIFPA